MSETRFKPGQSAETSEREAKAILGCVADEDPAMLIEAIDEILPQGITLAHRLDGASEDELDGIIAQALRDYATSATARKRGCND